MTLAGAMQTARDAAVRFGKPFVVYRMPGFDAEQVAVIAADRGLPPTAEVLETFHQDGRSVRESREAIEPAGEAVKRAPPVPMPLPIAPDDPQGSLF